MRRCQRHSHALHAHSLHHTHTHTHTHARASSASGARPRPCCFRRRLRPGGGPSARHRSVTSWALISHRPRPARPSQHLRCLPRRRPAAPTPSCPVGHPFRTQPLRSRLALQTQAPVPLVLGISLPVPPPCEKIDDKQGWAQVGLRWRVRGTQFTLALCTNYCTADLYGYCKPTLPAPVGVVSASRFQANYETG